jgi:hypothetical protein
VLMVEVFSGNDDDLFGVSVAWLSVQTPSSLSSWIQFSLRTHVKRVRQHSGCSGCSGFLPQGMLTGGVKINTVKKVISQLL